MGSVYVIVNESTPIGSNAVTTEIISPARYTVQDILEDLAEIARSAGVELDEDSSSVYVPIKGTHLESDEYYVIELEVLDRG